MKNNKIFAVLVLFINIFSFAADAQTGRKKNVKKSKTPPAKPYIQPAPKLPADAAANFKILVEGSQSKVEMPFIFVARDAETYALIRAMVEGLPESSTVDFSRSAVVAAFAGERNSGGWSVKIQQSAGRISIDVSAPPKGSMNTQVITYPFQVASFPLIEGQPLNVEASAFWTNRIQNYQVSKSDFEYSGGFAGRSVKFNAEGTIGVLTNGDYSTFFFNLSGKKSESARKLSGAGSGVKKQSGRDSVYEIARLDAGTFAETPHPPVKVTSTIDAKKITLNFESLPPMVADGYMLRGQLEAVKK